MSEMVLGGGNNTNVGKINLPGPGYDVHYYKMCVCVCVCVCVYIYMLKFIHINIRTQIITRETSSLELKSSDEVYVKSQESQKEKF